MEVACEYLDPLEFIGSINPLGNVPVDVENVR
jgi:hypothetical protein